MKVPSAKRMIMAAILAMVTAAVGLVNQAQAFQFGEGDLVLAIYGNNTEAMYNLGNFNDRLASGSTFTTNVLAGLQTASTGTNPVKYSLFEWDFSVGSGQIHAATPFSPAQIASTPGLLQFTNQFNPSVGMAGFDGDTIAKSDSRSFSSVLNTAGAGQLEGAWTVAMEGQLGQILNIMQGDVDTNTFTQVGRILLSANGDVTIGNPGPSAVPLPAGVILFGTGLIGLIGVARRSMNRMLA